MRLSPPTLASIRDAERRIEGIAVRTGQHCAQPVMDKFCIPATIRASLAIYNTREDIDALVLGLKRVKEVFA